MTLSMILLWMGGNPNAGGAAPNPLISFLPFVFIIAIMYFMMIRPQQKRQKEHQKMVAALGKGDKVITSGGIHGTVQGTKETSVIVKIADNVKVEVERSAVTAVVKSSGSESAETEEKK